MIKLYEIQGFMPAWPKYTLDNSEIKSDDCVTEGYFVTEKELRECFEASKLTDISQEGTGSYRYQNFEEWLKAKGIL